MYFVAPESSIEPMIFDEDVNLELDLNPPKHIAKRSYRGMGYK